MVDVLFSLFVEFYYTCHDYYVKHFVLLFMNILCWIIIIILKSFLDHFPSFLLPLMDISNSCGESLVLG